MTENLFWDAIVIRHEPDGKILASIATPYFNREDVLYLVEKILKFSNNFSIRGFHTNTEHVDFKNELEIYRN